MEDWLRIPSAAGMSGAMVQLPKVVINHWAFSELKGNTSLNWDKHAKELEPKTQTQACLTQTRLSAATAQS